MNRMPRLHRNLWALTVLGLLRERPMHPYEMQRLIRERGKDELLDLKRGSLYHAVQRLERAGLIEPVETSREGRRPERTVYRTTEAGVDQLLEWMRDLIARPTRETNEFVAAIAHLPHLSPTEAADLLERRAGFLKAEIAALDSVIETFAPRIGLLVLLESDLVRSLKRAELDWVIGLVADLRSGVHSWDIEEILAQPGTFPGPLPEEVSE
jgi:DNA-binding PadR family transcriptional regulator